MAGGFMPIYLSCANALWRAREFRRYRRQRLAFCVAVILLILIACGGSISAAQVATTSPAADGSSSAAEPSAAPAFIIRSPADGASITSPVPVAAASNKPGVVQLRLQLDGKNIFWTDQLSFRNEDMFLPTGAHTLTLVGYDRKDNPLGHTSIELDVTRVTTPTTFSQIQNMPNYEWCTATRAGHPCASGLGNATLKIQQRVAKPSLSGASAKFSIRGSQRYSNALWWKTLGGGQLRTRYTYKLDFMIDNPNAPEALEFDVNQSLGGVRYTFGTECSYRDTRHWDIWNDAKGVWETIISNGGSSGSTAKCITSASRSTTIPTRSTPISIRSGTGRSTNST
jgi:hypothetical protein